jgi:hypothetical protein
MRIDHTSHTHPATPEARATCRKLEAVRRAAGDAWHLGTDERAPYATVERDGRVSRVWAFVWPDWSRVSFDVYQGYPTEPKRISAKLAVIWAEVINDNPLTPGSRFV